jgi:hypothetical protein
MKNPLLLLPVFVMSLFFSSRAGADTPPAAGAGQIEDLRGQLTELKNIVMEQQKIINQQGQELSDLKHNLAPRETTYVPSGPGAASALPAWADGLKMGGDLRLRYDAFNRHTEQTRDVNRFRFRLRYGIEKQLNDEFLVGFRLATGSTTDPTSTNQTFTGDFTFKTIVIEKAYAVYRPGAVKEWLPQISQAEIGGGKVANPYAETSGRMMWDGDVTPEGVYEKVEGNFFEGRFRPFTILGQFVFNERTATATDAELFAYQAGYRLDLGPDPVNRPLIWTSALAYYDFTDVTNNANYIVSGTSLARGNTPLGSTDLDARDFNILNVYQDLGFRVANLPVKLFGEYDLNTNEQSSLEDNQNQAYQIGAGIGQGKRKGDWALEYYYAYIEPNSIVAAISESDFGPGHVNNRGNNFELGYMLTDFLKLKLKATFTESIVGTEDELSRYIADLEWKF